MQKFIVVIICLAALLSCKKNPNAGPDIKPQYQGNWEGTYTGANDNGTFIVSIDANGNASGTVTSIVFAETFALVGTVTSSGNITIAFGSLASGGSFTGVLYETKGSGTWEKKTPGETFSGNWTVKKL